MPDYKTINKYPVEVPYSRQPRERLVKKMVNKKTEPSQRRLIRNELSKRIARGEV